MNGKKLIVFVDRGNILRSPVAECITNWLIESNGLTTKYLAISRRIQGVSPEDPTPPLHNNYFQYEPGTQRILTTKHFHRSDSPLSWNALYRLYPIFSPIENKVALWLINSGIDLTDHRSSPMGLDIAHQAACIFALDNVTHGKLLRLYPQEQEKIHLLSEIIGKNDDILDPEKADPDDQLLILNLMSKQIRDGFHTMLEITNNSFSSSRERSLYNNHKEIHQPSRFEY